MKKFLIAFLALCTVGMTAYAAPAFEAPEAAAELTGEAEAADLSGTYANGINLITGTSAVEDFESFSEENTYNGTNCAFSMSNTGGHAIVHDTETDNTYLKVTSTDAGSYSHIYFAFPSAIPAGQKFLISFKYYQHLGEGNLWIYGPSHEMECASNANFVYRNSDKIFWLNTKTFNNITQTFKGTDAWYENRFAYSSIGSVSNLDIYYPKQSADGYMLLDDISVIPFYSVKYMMNNGTDEVYATDSALIDEDGNVLTEYTVDTGKKPVRAGYNLVGWSDKADGEAKEKVALTGDLTLYAIWEEKSTKSWTSDFEDGSKGFVNSQFGNIQFGSIVNGRLPVTYTGEGDQGAAYIQVMSEELPNADYKYLLFKTDKEFTATVYYSVGQDGFAPNFTISTSVVAQAPDGDKWLLADFSAKDAFMTDEYIHKIMLAIRGTADTYLLDEVTFTNDYLAYIADCEYPECEYHFNISKKLATLGTTSAVYTNGANGEPGFLTVTKPASGNFAFYVEKTDFEVNSEYYKYFVIKTAKGTAPGGFYFTTSKDGNFDEAKHVSFKCASYMGYNYMYYDFTDNANYVGNLGRLMVQQPGVIYDVYVSTKRPVPDFVGWDFEDNKASGLSGWGNTALTGCENGKAIIVRDYAGKGNEGAMNSTLQFSADKYKYAVIHADAPANFKIYYDTSASTGYAEAKTATSALYYTAPDGTYYMVADFSEKAGYAGNVNKMMLAGAMSDGTYAVDEFYFVADLKEFFGDITLKYEMNLVGRSGYNAEDGCIHFGTSSYFNMPATGVKCADYPYIVFRGPASETLTAFGGFYFTSSAGTSHAESQHVRPDTKQTYTDGKYNYIYWNIPADPYGAAWTGTQSGAGWMMQVGGVIDSIFLTNKLDFIPSSVHSGSNVVANYEEVTITINGAANKYAYGEVFDLPSDLEDENGENLFLGWGLGTDPTEVAEGINQIAIENAVISPVWMDATPDNESTSFSTESYVGTEKYEGLSFNSTISDEQYNKASEYGFITTLESILTTAGVAADEFTYDSGVKYVDGVAYNKANGIDIHKDIDDETGDVEIAAFVYSATGKVAEDINIVVRPYIVFNVNGADKYFYGDARVDNFGNYAG